MSIVGGELKNAKKRLKVQHLMTLAESARPNLSHSDKAKAGEANFTLGQCFLEQGKVAQALAYFQTAIDKCPESAKYLSQLSKAHLMLRNDEEALTFALQALVFLQGETDANTHNTLGYVLTRFGHHKFALGLFEKAVKLNPNSIEFRDNLARSHTYFGDKRSTALQYEALLKLDSLYGKAHLGLAEITKCTAENNHIDRLENALEKASRKIEIMRIQYALSKENEDLGQSEESFKHLHSANTQFMSNVKFDVKHDEELIGAFLDVYKKSSTKNISKIDDKVLFIGGIPRTGTTLVDRILSAHSSVESAGELQSMPLAVKQASGTNSKIVLDIETITKAGKADINAVGRAYMTNARLHVGAKDSAVFTDKLPLNFMYAGFILKALPNAKMVCLRRHPMDAIWSNYKHLFGGGARYHTYSYDLISTARFYLAYLKMTDFWAQEFPEQFMILNYEDLIADQRSESANLLEHCGLDWEEGCLDFHSSSKAVATPSANQVREPLYTGSIGKWKRYAKELEGVRLFLIENGVKV